MRKLTAKGKNKRIIKKIKSQTKLIHSVKLVCSTCKKEFFINTTKPELYTNEIKKSWKCLTCKLFKKEE